METTSSDQGIKDDPYSLQIPWEKEFEEKAMWGNRIFCFTFLVCYPLTSILYYLNGNPNYQSILLVQLTCSGLVALIIFLHFREKIDSQNASFFSRILLIIFHAYILARFETINYYGLSINLTLQLIFSVWVLRWKFSYAVISSVIMALFFSLALYSHGADVLILFLKEGGFFYFLGLCVFPLILQMRYIRQYREFVFAQRLQKQNKELEKQNQLVRDAMQAKSDFFSIMSHEIRTPLNGIVGVIHLLLQEDLRTALQRELVGTLKFSSDQLMAIINDVLDLNKITSRHVKLAKEPFNLSIFLRNIEKTFIPRAQEKKLDLIFEIDSSLPVHLTGDQVRLNQIITNLLHNAVKFTERGFVKLAVREVERDQSQILLQFEISDSGIGIPLEDQSSIFEIFVQSSLETSRGNRGTGLGLAITKELVQLFGSEIKLKSEQGHGSRFSFCIYFTYSDQQPVDRKPVDVRVVLPNARVLVVDDNAVNRMIVTILLDKIGLKYDKAENGLEAVERFGSNHYDLVLMDLGMPIMNGFEATQIIRAQDSQTPIIALTASAFTEERDKAMSSGFSEYLVKPFLPKEFYDMIFTFLETEPTAQSEARLIQSIS
ncbi:response regulator [Dyadobacter sp. CY343]|uniref:response regulator n=1 Tax=Dyadobacter sp. CY343 TaxID=2907299 RepID=UPI001F31FC66|nr:response regulator [Dyadobacter sp. CY343]MCE7063209.1 response regulator [Dyadobacter sp. CY343]